jgi:hypothetical protein
MIIKNFYIEEVFLNNYEQKTGKMQIKVKTSDSSTPIFLEAMMGDNLEKVAAEIIKKIKLIKKPVDNEKGFLGGIAIASILNAEEAREGIFKGLVRIDSKIANAKRVHIASEYMKAYQQINTLQDVLFKWSGQHEI